MERICTEVTLYRPEQTWLLPVSGGWLTVCKRGIRACTGCFLILLLTLSVAVTSGTEEISWTDIYRLITGGGNPVKDFILSEVRLPRTGATLLSGAGMGLSGCLLQAIFRNPLATPDVLGLNEGAAFAIVIYMLSATGSWPYWIAPVGGLIMAALLYLLCRLPGHLNQSFLITGIALGELVRACTEFIMSTGALYEVRSVWYWLNGNFTGQGPETASKVALLLATTLPALILLKGKMGMFALPEPVSLNLGFPLRLMQLTGIMTAAFIAAISTSIGGPVVFISLAAPVIAGKLVRDATPSPVASALLGACLLTLCDTLGRTLTVPNEIAAGIISKILGGGFLLWFLFHSARRQRG